MTRIALLVATALNLVVTNIFGPPAATERRSSDRGDVPGWVMITVMSAIVVIALLAVFREQVVDAVRNAFSDVDSQRGTD